MMKETKCPSLKPVKYINDPIYGGIPVTELELELINTKMFQRLRGLRQLGRVNFVFPGAEHSRYVHSLGVLYIMGLMTNHLLETASEKFNEKDAIKMRIAALLHDIGHYPLSHLGESVYSFCQDNARADSDILDIEFSDKKEEPIYVLASTHSKSAHHEQLGKEIVNTNNEIKEILNKYGLDPKEIGAIFTGEIGDDNIVYCQLLHSSLDADRLDYLLRDSYQTGVKYGLVDLQYLIRLLKIEENKEIKKNVLVLNKKGQHVVEHFLMSRYFHYSQVIFHKTNTSFEGAIKAIYIKLIQDEKFLYNSYREVIEGINSEEFIDFNDALLDTSLLNYFKENKENKEIEMLYNVYKNRIRPKTIFELKDLYAEESSKRFTVLKWILKKEPHRITKLVGSDMWGYQIVPITIEKIQKYETTQRNEEDLRESVKVYDSDKEEISYLADDSLSIISRLSNYKSEFIRIYVMESKTEKEYREIKNSIQAIIES